MDSQLSRIDLLQAVNRAFGEAPRPEHFTNYQHCEECREIDERMCSRDQASLALGDIENSVLPLLNSAGYRYYMPAFIRLALSQSGEGFMADLVTKLSTPISAKSRPPHLRQTDLFSVEETNAVLAFLCFVRDERREILQKYGVAEKVMARALRNWDSSLF